MLKRENSSEEDETIHRTKLGTKRIELGDGESNPMRKSTIRGLNCPTTTLLREMRKP